MSQFEQWEIDRAQKNLDIQPSFSPYWESRSGQDDLQVIQELNLQPATTEQERRHAHCEAMREHLDGSGAYCPSAAEVERSELQGDRIAMFRAEY